MDLIACAISSGPAGGVPMIIDPRSPAKRGIISIPMRPPSDQPKTNALVMPSSPAAQWQRRQAPGACRSAPDRAHLLDSPCPGRSNAIRR